jgi:adenine-specific DNA glycosylase
MEYPKKAPKKARKAEEKTVLVMQDETRVALAKREERGLLAGFYEFPCLPGKQSDRQVLEYLKRLGFVSLRIQKIGEAKHIFTHKEWHMTGYLIRTDELANQKTAAEKAGFIFAEKEEIERNYPLPSAYAAYAKYLDITQGADKFRKADKR